MSNEPRVVVLTGTSAGIGLEAAIQFAQRGDTVVATMRTLERDGDLRAAAEAAGVELDIQELDVADDASSERAFTYIFDTYGHVDVLVANAGIGWMGSLEELSLDDLRRAMEVNFYGVVRAAKAVLPSMRARGDGRIIAVSSVAGAMGQPFTDAYCASKHAVEGLLESTQPVVARFGVKISIVEPGPVGTDFHDKSVNAEADTGMPEYRELREHQAAFMDGGNTRRQAPPDAAAVIVAVADDVDPKLRYQTSNFTTKLVGFKLADVTGEKVTGFTSSWLDPLPPAE